MICEMREPKKAAALFGDWPEAVIWSCLQGVMGKLYADSQEDPSCVMAILGDFCYFAGKPSRELVLYKPEWFQGDFIIMGPQNEAWERMIRECYGSKAKKVMRYAIKKEPGIFDEEHLRRAAASLPEGFSMGLIDEPLFWRCRETAWCRDWVRNYLDYEKFQENGLGVVISKDGEPVSGASSYCGFRGGIEIEIITREDFRRRGLAYACGAGLILECLKRGLYPSWDAQNPWSAALARKLGYHFDHEYVSYEIRGYGVIREAG